MTKYKDFEYTQLNDGRILSTFPNIGQMLFNSMDEFNAYVDGYHTTKDCFTNIETELRNAIEKHPEFCSAIIDPASSKSWIETERQIKLRNECGPEYADCILMEEMAEAFAAYEQGDKAHCIQELAQCGAVIIRMMEFVKKEMAAAINSYTLDVSCSPMDYARSLNHTKQQRIKRNGRKGK